MKTKRSTILFIFVFVSVVFLLNSCGTIPIRKPLPQESGDTAQIPDIPRARFWGDAVPSFAGAVYG
jgi:hypothetical protein